MPIQYDASTDSAGLSALPALVPWRCVRKTVLSDLIGLGGSVLRVVEAGELVYMLEPPRAMPEFPGVVRMRVFAMRDRRVGYVTVQANAGPLRTQANEVTELFALADAPRIPVPPGLDVPDVGRTFPLTTPLRYFDSADQEVILTMLLSLHRSAVALCAQQVLDFLDAPLTVQKLFHSPEHPLHLAAHQALWSNIARSSS